MLNRALPNLPALYLDDETAWLQAMAALAGERRFDELDHEHLREFLLDMARRDKREVLSRLTVLLVHLLKWEHQPDKRSNSWQATILSQRQELHDLLESATLRRHASEVLPRAYHRAVQQAAIETGLGDEQFPAGCPWILNQIVAEG